MERLPCVYILASDRNGTLYVGVTSNLIQRVAEHRQEAREGFTKRYRIHELVWYEVHSTMETAILREEADQEVGSEGKVGTDRERKSGLARSVG